VERVDVVFIHPVGFFVAALAFGVLLLEAAALVFRVVEFAEAVGDFHLSGENFPALGPVGLVGFLLGERRNSSGGFIDDCRLGQMLFGCGFEQSRDCFPGWLFGVISDMCVASIEALNELGHGLVRGEVGHL